MTLQPLGIEGAWIVEHEPHYDERGWFVRTFDERLLREHGIEHRMVEGSASCNTAVHTLRGMHYQREPAAETKVIRCNRGRVFDVLVDARPASATYRQWVGVELVPDDGRTLIVGPGLAHGFLTLLPDTEVGYLISARYTPELAAGMRWDDPAIGIEWPATPAVMSERDRSFPLLAP